MATEKTRGTLALGGGAEFTDAAQGLGKALLEASGAKEVLVIPTAAAFEHPERIAEQVGAFLKGLGARPRVAMALNRSEIEEASLVDSVHTSKFVVLTDGSPMHLRSALKGSKFFEALVAAHLRGASIWASGAGAMVLCDPMVDQRGGAYTVGFGLVSGLAVFPHHDTAPAHLWERSVELRPAETVLAGVDESAVLVRGPLGEWRVDGSGSATLLGPDGEKTYGADSVIRTLTM